MCDYGPPGGDNVRNSIPGKLDPRGVGVCLLGIELVRIMVELSSGLNHWKSVDTCDGFFVRLLKYNLEMIELFGLFERHDILDA
jgi:hypothetical protein